MRIAFCTTDWGHNPEGMAHPGGANWVRIQTPARQLAAAGHEVQIGFNLAVLRSGKIIALNEDDQPMGGGEPADVVVLQRWMHKDAPKLIRGAREQGQVVINDCDDWFDGLDPANQAFDASHPSRNSEVNRNHYRAALGASSMLTVSTPYLASRLAPLGTPIRVVRNAIRVQDFDIAEPSDTSTGLLVAWVGGVNWRSGDLETIKPWFGPWLRANGCRFLHHGVFPVQEKQAWDILGLDHDLVAGWRPVMPPHIFARVLLKGFDIGLVPLSDIPFNQAKSWIKGLEYAAAGIPFVAAKTDEYDALGAGFTARRPRDWIKHMDRLLDPEVRLAQSIRGLEASRRNDISVRWVDWEQAYLDALAMAR